MRRRLGQRPTMNDHPAPAPTPPPPAPNDEDHTLRLNNWLQAHGWRPRLILVKTNTGPDHEPTWCAVYKCPFRSPPRLLYSYLWPTVDGEECGRSEARKFAHAREEAARIALQNIADRMGVPAP
jgi:hypothetical protein